MKKLQLSILILLLFLVQVFSICCGKKESAEKSIPKTAQQTVIIDALGRKVTIPDKVERVVSPFTMYTRIIVAVGAGDKLVGISHSCVLPEEEYACAGKLLEIPDVGPFGNNVELIASLRPDIIFASAENVRSLEEKTGATVICVSFSQDTKMEEMFYKQIGIIGVALHKEKEAKELTSFIKEKLAKVTDITSKIPESEKPKVYFAWTSWTGDITNTVVDFDPIELAGGINLARQCRNFPKGERGILVSKEHIIKWNPDIIFLSRYKSNKWEKAKRNGKKTPVTIEDVLSNPILQTVNAVKNRRVYYTTAFCNWWPHQRAIAQTLYMARIFHPDKFKDLDVEKEGNEIFKRFYGVDNLYTELAKDLEFYKGD
jgi:iron complex transport system substrate-binding protein